MRKLPSATVFALMLMASAHAGVPDNGLSARDAMDEVLYGAEDDAASALGKLSACDNSDVLHRTVDALRSEGIEKTAQALKLLVGTCRLPTANTIPELLFKEAAQTIYFGSTDDAARAFKRVLIGPWDYYHFVCRALGFYEINVAPDGTFSPLADLSAQAQGSILITLLPPPKDEVLPDEKYVLIVEAGESTPFTSKSDKMNEHVSVRRVRANSWFDVTASYKGAASYEMHLTLKPADRGWMFSIYNGGLRTDSEARHLNIQVPTVEGHQMQWKPESIAFLTTGPCEKGALASGQMPVRKAPSEPTVYPESPVSGQRLELEIQKF